MPGFPAANYINVTTRTNAQVAAALEDWLAQCKQQPAGGGIEDLTVSADVLMPTKAVCIVTPESGSTDQVRYIQTTNVQDGHWLLLMPASGKSLTLCDAEGGSGEMLLQSGDFVLLDGQSILLVLDGTQWREFGRFVGWHGAVRYSTPGSHTFTVPAGVRFFKVEMCGGGGGGGAAAHAGGNGADGAAGGTTTFGGWSAAGGSAGKGGLRNGRGGKGGAVSGCNGQCGISGAAWSAQGGLGGPGIQGGMGGGGTGGDAQASGYGAGGGGGGKAPKVEWVTNATAGTNYPITVGAGGAGGNYGQTYGGGNGFSGVVTVEW